MRILLFVLLFALVSCNNSQGTKQELLNSNEQKKVFDSLVVIETDSNIDISNNPESKTLPITGFYKIKAFPFKDKIDALAAHKRVALNEKDWATYNYSMLEKFNSAFSYANYGYFKINEQIFILLERKYSEESIHWLCAVDINLNLADYLMLSYENSEGMFESYSTLNIKDKKLVILTNKYEFDSAWIDTNIFINYGFAKL